MKAEYTKTTEREVRTIQFQVFVNAFLSDQLITKTVLY